MDAQQAKAVEQFLARYPIKSYKKGQLLLLADEDPTYAYFLISGRVKQYDITSQGLEITINTFKPMSYFLVQIVLSGIKNRYYFSAETDIKVHQIPREDIIRFIFSDKEALSQMFLRACRAYDEVLRRISYFMAGNARGRVIYEILLEARSFGEAEPRYPYTLGITETTLAARAGLSRETVSREISDLKKHGFLSGPKITIPHKEPLERALEDER